MSEEAAEGPIAPLGHVLRERFELVEVIGEGGMSTVYRAVDRVGMMAREASADVAVKVIRPDPSMRDEMVELLHREAWLLRRLVHRNLARIYDSDFDGPYHFLVMELLHGRSLATIMNDRQGRPLTPDVSLRIVRSVASGLTHMHELGIIHGDLKPGNVFMTVEGEVKLLDFGTALLLDPPSHHKEVETTAMLLDRVGAMTPAYASLEMLSGRPRAESDDVYSLAVLAYLVLTGGHPFQNRSAEQAQKEGLTPAPPATLSATQWHVLQAGLALKRADRIQTVSEFAQRLGRPAWRDRLIGRLRRAKLS